MFRYSPKVERLCCLAHEGLMRGEKCEENLVYKNIPGHVGWYRRAYKWLHRGGRIA